ncbi:hypothetical protein PHMEG_00039566 [Phytophthora megakarya]|uniref:Uncharacterized protein n=1 Tax=Phytophthora megakarya TaxID=4795 RepID=A0A225UFI1_9STRA|nr:hypothetical protein PHMEG_00039566 [Phytophthora megakarya]
MSKAAIILKEVPANPTITLVLMELLPVALVPMELLPGILRRHMVLEAKQQAGSQRLMSFTMDNVL